MKYVFGPLPSRRLGQSLGIDPIPEKTCNWSCVYCQLGRTRPLINERKEYITKEAIIEEVRETLTSHKPGDIDWITFVGSGEPTLHSGLGWMIRQVKAMTDIPVAVITNGSLLYLPEVREDLLAADAVLPSLNSGTEALYQKINRPYHVLTFDKLVSGLLAFRQEYKGKLWIEVMLIKDLNDTEEALHDLATVLSKIKPDAVHIVLPTRPAAESWVKVPDEEGLMRARAILSDIAEVVHPVEGNLDLSGCDNLIDAVINIISRHPVRQIELEKALAKYLPEGQSVSEMLEALKSSGRAKKIERHGTFFWASPSQFPDDDGVKNG
ncbi:MAG: radical SAM protein [Chlorobiales bacterium]|nr:radical SAM protein [Chlorobiales bacterium]